MFLNPNIFFPIWIIIVVTNQIWETSRIKLKSILLPKIVLTSHCLNKLFEWSQKICKFSAFSLEFPKFFLITRIFFFLIVGLNNFGNTIQISHHSLTCFTLPLGKCKFGSFQKLIYDLIFFGTWVRFKMVKYFQYSTNNCSRSRWGRSVQVQSSF